MTDTSNVIPADAATVPAPDDQQAQEPDWKAEARKWEQRAKDNQKAARENQAAAQQLKALEDSQKTELQKVAERAEAAERRAAELEQAQARTALLTEVSNETKVPTELLSGPSDITRDGLEDYAKRLSAWVQSGAGGIGRFPVVMNPGGQPSTAANEDLAFIRGVFGGNT